MRERISPALRERTALGRAYAAVTDERERLADEVDAFESFLSRTRTLDPVAEPPDATRQRRSSSDHALVSQHAASSRRADAFSEVREAYRETVLAVDHWESFYGERTVEESLPNEFSTELANVVLDPRGTAFSPWIADRLRAETREEVQNRTTSYRYLDEEVTALETLSTELDAVLESVRPVVEGDETFAERRQRLETAVETLDELARTRQDYLHRRADGADSLLRGMVYHELDVEYPGLDAIAAVRRAIDRLTIHFWAGIL
jgi:hypothetical protein